MSVCAFAVHKIFAAEADYVSTNALTAISLLFFSAFQKYDAIYTVTVLHVLILWALRKNCLEKNTLT